MPLYPISNFVTMAFFIGILGLLLLQKIVVITKRNDVRIALCMRVGRFDVYRIWNLSKKSIVKRTRELLGFFYLIIRITFVGFPTTTALSGTSWSTTLPAPIIALLPMVTPPRIQTLPPIQTLFLMVIGRAIII